MSLDAIVSKIKDQAATLAPLGSTVKFKIDDTVLHIDGTGDSNEITTEDKDAECTISTSMETFVKLRSGDLNPMMAVMTGKIKIKGDMSIAMKLQSLMGG